MAKLEFFDGTDWQIIESSSPISIDLQGDVTGTYNNGIINTTLAKTLENPSGIWRFNLLNATISTQRIFSSFEYAFNALSSVGNTFSHIFKDLTQPANDLSFDAVFTSGQEAFFDFKRGATSLLKIKGGEIDFVSKKLINVANGTSNNDAINLSQLNQSIFNATATIPKQSCQCATTASFSSMYNVTSYTYNNGASGIGATISLTLLTGTQIAIDGYVPRQGDRILVKNQSLEHNGIYILTTAPSASTVILTRATDYDYIGKITQNDYIDIIFGTINGATCFNQTYFAPITVGSSYISFTRINPKDCLLRTNNLSDLSNVVDARWNLNVYSLASPISNGLTLSVNTTTMVATFGLNSELNTLANLNTTGILARTGTGTYATRSLAAGTGITITNGNGVSGNPSISLSNTTVTSGTYASPSSLTVNAQGQITSITEGSAPITSLTLTGAVTGSGSSSIATTLGSIQNLAASNIDFNWPYGGTATYDSNINHYLIDTSGTTSTSPSVVETIQSGSGSTKRYWNMRFNPGAPNLPGPYFSIGFYHNTFTGSYVNGVSAFSINYISAAVPKFGFTFNGDVQATGRFYTSYVPVNNVDLVNKLYADSLITAQLSALSSLSTTGIMVRTAANTFATRTLTADTGISITNGNGVSGNPTVAIGTVPIANLSGYSVTGTNFLRQDGTWTKPLINDLLISGNVNISTYNFTTSGTISASTGALKANNLFVHNSSAIVCDPLAVTGGYSLNYSSYGYLNGSGLVGTASGTNTYSINATHRVKASEFNAVSSIKKKRVVSQGLEIEKEVVDIIKKTEFFKYEYKDQIAEKGIRYGVIAEELGKVLPDYVDYNNMEYIPNIMQVGKVQKIKDCQYIIKLENEIDNIVKINRLKLINSKNKVIEVEISDIIDLRTLKINSKENLSQKVFVYGTYEECPSVANKVTELALIAVKNLLTRIEKLEEIQYE
jgi:hypothetical protein